MKNGAMKIEIYTIAATMAVLAFVLSVSIFGNMSVQVGTETIQDSPVAMAAKLGDGVLSMDAPYFERGVYANYSEGLENPELKYFYVFEDGAVGHTEDSTVGIGLPFKCTQTNGKIMIRFGGDEEPEEILNITAVENGVIYGYFDGAEDRPMSFKLIEDADPDSFDAVEYMNAAR
ncbi:hypothetical protein [Butyrivibrio sp. VCD2006]|uniref:hypothetical protein n=1 Tax=Butyrivibrio sp. VCD2006 TaxID=1280664 RepID=UPI000403FC4B|nr:hypothetical protein [Butyrivibrio sp. VCD2006]